jgi:hypothetical protein
MTHHQNEKDHEDDENDDVTCNEQAFDIETSDVD